MLEDYKDFAYIRTTDDLEPSCESKYGKIIKSPKDIILHVNH